MKLHEALRKVIRHFGVNVIEEKRLMSFLADYKAFDDYPAVKEVMKCIATGDSGKKICLAADGSDEEFLRIASEIRETLVREKSFKEEFARYAVDSVSFALGIVSDVTEPGDHGYEAVQKTKGSRGSSAAQERQTQVRPAVRKSSAPKRKSFGTASVISGNTWLTASDGAESHRRFYRGHDLTAAFDSGEFSENVADGSFRDIFPGDYIIKHVAIPDIKMPSEDGSFPSGFYSRELTRAPDGVIYFPGKTYTIKFIIADLDVAMNHGYPRVAAHHAVIVPEMPVFEMYMNSNNTNEGGYAGSFMHKTVMPAFAHGLIGAFGTEHLIGCSFDDSHRAPPLLPCTCRLMTLSMVVGQTLRKIIWSESEPDLSLSWSDIRKDNCLGGTQLAAFNLHPNLQGKGHMRYWVSDLQSRPSSYFVNLRYLSYCVIAHADYAYQVYGVRPFTILR